MRIMAIDYGDARIGLAVSDLTGILCGEAWTMEEWNMERASKRIAEEAARRDVGTLVLGLPKNMDGTEGPRARAPKRAAPLPSCCAPTAVWRSCCGTSGAARSRRTRSCTRREKRKRCTAGRSTLWRPA